MSDYIELRITVDNLTENVVQENGELANKATENSTANTIKWLTVYKNAKSLAQKATGNAISNIGLITGNYALQQQVEQTIGVASRLAGIGMAFAMGGVAGGVMAVAGTAIDMANQVYVYNKERGFANINASHLRERAGFTAGGNR